MSEGIAYQNKDILLKILSDNYPHVSFKTYGLDLPAIKEVLPTDLPDIKANEVRTDGVFLLDDDSLLIVDYESSVKTENFLKYGHYAFRVLERYWRTKKKLYNVTIAVIYTSDVESAPVALDMGGLQINVRQCFLRNIDGDETVRTVREKIEKKEPLSDEDVLRLIVAPLSKSKSSKQALLEECVDLAKKIENERLQIFIITGLLVASDKFVDQEYSNRIRRWLGMTKIGQIIQEEIEAAATAEAAAKEREIAKNLLRKGMAVSDIAECTGLSKTDVESLLLN